MATTKHKKNMLGFSGTSTLRETEAEAKTRPTPETPIATDSESESDTENSASEAENYASDAEEWNDLEEAKGNWNTTKNKNCNVSSTKQKSHPKKRNFSNKWLDDPLTKDWIMKSKDLKRGIYFACCKVCKVEIVPHRTGLRRHRDSAKHRYLMNQVVTTKKINNMFGQSIELKVKAAELKLVGLLATNVTVPFLP
ncbi:unnamed protein product [Psylliodes chrysocephalus]|uniref:Uncharacterized protein n=1 Tax=Psylliodes chrysocephalus TaxID=3402493 RepID=A0A9P0CQ36_9CUCU|nr:unnamed protein product [Psylliodes chrysocephala]